MLNCVTSVTVLDWPLLCRELKSTECDGIAQAKLLLGSGVRDQSLFTRVLYRCCEGSAGRPQISVRGSDLHSDVSKSSPVVVGPIAISGVRLRKFTQQLSIVSRNREHNRGNAKSAESSAEPKHSHRESHFEFSL